jgi:hypothetical protein
MSEHRRKPPSHQRRFAFPNMIITIAVMPALTRPANKAKNKARISRRR